MRRAPPGALAGLAERAAVLAAELKARREAREKRQPGRVIDFAARRKG
jgi:hypothetical protein